MGYLREIVEYGRRTERDRQRLVQTYRQTEAAYLLVGAILLAGLVCGLTWLAQRDTRGWQQELKGHPGIEHHGVSKQVRARTAYGMLSVEKEAWIK